VCVCVFSAQNCAAPSETSLLLKSESVCTEEIEACVSCATAAGNPCKGKYVYLLPCKLA
jgi:hypothetical protein